MNGTNGGLNISTALNGSLRATGQIANQGGNAAGAIAGILGNSLGRNVGQLTNRVLDQRADIRGTVAVTARPALLQNWRIEPNLTGSVALSDGGHQHRRHQDQRRRPGEAAARPDRERADRQSRGAAAQRPHAGACRAQAVDADVPLDPARRRRRPARLSLWLEMRPTRAFAAQPRIMPDWVILTVGVQAETRIVPTATKPECPFPARLDLVSQQLDQGEVKIAVPIDVPFTELNRVMEAQLKGKTFPETGSGKYPARSRCSPPTSRRPATGC